MELHPVHALDYVLQDQGKVSIKLPRFNSRIWGPLLMPFVSAHNQFILINLDDFGSACWLAIDGKKNVDEIAQELVAKFGKDIEPIEERLPKFLSLLYEQRYITFKELEV